MTTPPATPGFIAWHLLLVSVGWGSAFMLMKLMVPAVDPVVVAGARASIAALGIAAWIVAIGQSPWPKREEILPWLLLGVFAGWVPNVLAAFAVTRLDSGPAALIQASSPLITAIGAHFAFSDERLSGRRALGVVIGLFGVALLIGPKAFDGRGTILAVIAMLTVALLYAVTNLYIKTISGMGAERMALGQQSVSGIIGLVFALMVAGPQGFVAAGDHLGTLVALGLWATALPMFMFMRLIRAAGPTRGGMGGYTVPTVAALLGVVVLGERLTAWQVAGGVIALVGVWLVTTSKGKPA